MPKHDHVPNRNTYDTYNGLVRKSSQGYNSGNGFDNSVGEIDQKSSIKIEEEGGDAPHSHDINLGANSNYQPYVALTYIMKVKADKIATLDITLGDSEFDEFETTGGTLGEIGFETTNLKLSDGHPTWTSNGHLYVRGTDIWMNTLPSRDKGDSGRQQGRALVTDTTGLTINYAGDFDQVNLRGDKVIAGDLSNAEIDAAGNKSLVTKEYLESHEIPQEPWTDLTLASGWANYGVLHSPSSWGNTSYYKDSLGRVHLRGLFASSGGGTVDSLVATLPEGYRVDSQKLFSGSRANNAYARIDISPSGGIYYRGPGTTPGWVSLDGISFISATHPRTS
jgi:hypothetical protein